MHNAALKYMPASWPAVIVLTGLLVGGSQALADPDAEREPSRG